MQLKFGSFPVMVASSAEVAKQILKTHDHVFASRPQTAAGKYITYNYLNITWAPYGPYWRQGRKIFLSELFSSKRLETFQYIRVEEMRAFVSRLGTLSGKPIMLKDHLSRLTLSIISRIVLGDWIPWLNFLDLQGYVKRMKALKKKVDRFYDHVFDEHKAKKERVKHFVPKDMVDLLLQLSDDPDLDVRLTYEGVKGFTQCPILF
nr:cytochrome p450 71a9 [Quercus suber]